MSRRLTANVVVDGVTYAGGSVPPPDVAKQITNPVAWAPEPADVDAAPATPVAEPKTRRRPSKAPARPAAKNDANSDGASDSADSPGDDSGSEQSPSTDPPAGNASTQDWAAFAQTVGVQVPDDAGREDIKAALTERGLLELADS